MVTTIAHIAPDILHLNGFDYDLHGHAIAALQTSLRTAGVDYPYLLSLRANTGMDTGLDMDGDGRLGGPGDGQGFGRFSGQGGMAIISRLPIDEAAVRDFSGFLWHDLPGAIAPVIGEAPFPSADAFRAQRLSSVGHWDVPVILPDGGELHFLAFHATTPVFDGPEDQNGRRNHDEVTFWRLYLEGLLPFAPPAWPVVVLGDANLDPVDGEGRRAAISALLNNSRLQDPIPESQGGVAAANQHHAGDPSSDTVDWRDPVPGNLRVDYVLPDAALKVVAAGVFWPAPGEAMAETVAAASRHRLVWVDVELP